MTTVAQTKTITKTKRVAKKSDKQSSIVQNVLHVLPSLKSGGVERYVYDLAKAMHKKGIHSVVASSGGEMASALCDGGVSHVTLGLHTKNPLLMLFNAWKLIRLGRSHSIQVIHAHSRAPAWSALLAARVLKIPLVTTYHARYNAHTVFKKWYNSVMVRADHVITDSQFLTDHVKMTYPKRVMRDSEKISQIYCGVDTATFSPQALVPFRTPENPLYKRLPSKKTRPIILLMPARFNQGKGHTLVVEAFSKLSPHERRKLMILMVGDQEKHPAVAEEITSMIRCKGLSEYIMLFPHQKDLLPFYAMSDVVLCPSTQPEGFGLVVLEAGAVGLPVIASACGGSLEAVVPDVTGWLFQPENPQDLTDVLRAVTLCPQKALLQLGKNARKHVCSLFSKDLMVSKVLHTYTLQLSSRAEHRANTEAR